MTPRLFAAALFLAVPIAAAAQTPPPCPAEPVRVVRSRGGTIDYLGTVPGLPDLCRLRRTGDGAGTFYLGTWRADWPGAGEAYPAMHQVIAAGSGATASFTTRSVPGMQWLDSFRNEGVEPVRVAGADRPALRIAHEREGIEGNTYHSVITQWKDLATGATLRTEERQIAGRSYGPDTTWTATRLERLP